MFPAPRQRWVDAMAHDEADVRGIRAKTLLVHGRDDKVIPLSTSLTLLDWIDNSQARLTNGFESEEEARAAVGPDAEIWPSDRGTGLWGVSHPTNWIRAGGGASGGATGNPQREVVCDVCFETKSATGACQCSQ
ncbi:MAG: hypothetical protein V9G19_18910 [Tetrasphaera sp.]